MIASLWLIHRTYQRSKPYFDLKLFLKDLILQVLNLMVIPVGVATLISEILSSFCIRQRPFVTMADIKLLVPHSADGGMPSHHMVFMVAIAAMVFLFSKRLGILLIILSLISGIARISAGIHYPSDVLAGALAGGVLAITYARTVLKGRYKLVNLN